jgi:hypothetical protein
MNKILAIKGHPTRGREVIELLEMMGGVNRWKASGNIEKVYYRISNGVILYGPQIEKDTVIYTLEEFLKKYPFKAGDKVVVRNGELLTIKSMEWSEHCETMVYDFKDAVIVLAAEDLKVVGDTSLKIGKNTNTGIEFDLTKYDYEVKDGKLVISEKKPLYPQLTNLTECKEILGERDMYQSVSGYKGEILTNFQLLFIFRDVYWKIAGEQLGLGKPWEPDWEDETQVKYMITTFNNKLEFFSSIHSYVVGRRNHILSFPTEEMRDAFFENFKDLIEKCKELL